jgi:hydrogenase maturation protease
LGWDDVPRALLLKVSPHQESIAESLALLELRKGRPEAMEVIGAQPGSLDWGSGLTPPVEAAVETAIDAVLEILRTWGHDVRDRAGTGGDSVRASPRRPS